MATSEIIITELAGLKRVLHLGGAGLPKRGANWPGKQRLVTTWYPGNVAQATQQVLGPVEMQSQWSGEWNTTRLVRSPATYVSASGINDIAFADMLREIMEDFFRRGSLMQVTWVVDPERIATASGSPPSAQRREITRVGRASDWNFAYDRIDDIVWTTTWDWTGRGATQDKVALRNDGAGTQALQDLDLVLLGVDEVVNNTKIQTTQRTIPKSANKLSLEQIGAILDAPGKLMKDFAQTCNRISNRVKTLGDLIGKAANLPFAITNQALDVALTASQAANSFYDNCTRTPPDYYDTKQRLADMSRIGSYFSGGLKASQIVAQHAAETANALKQTQTQRAGTGPNGKGARTTGPVQKPGKNTGGAANQVAVYLVQPGDTLIGISQKFYKTPDGAVDIAFANNLPLKTAQPPVGKVLIIPPYKGMGATPSPKPPIKPSTQTNPVLPGGVGQKYPYPP